MNFTVFLGKIKDFAVKVAPYLKILKNKLFIILGSLVVLLTIVVICLLNITVDYYVLNFKGEPIGYARSEETVSGAVSEISSKFSQKEEIISEMENFSVSKITSSNLFLSCFDKSEFMDVISAAAESIYKGYSLYIDGNCVASLKSEKTMNSVIENFKTDRVAISKYLSSNNDSCTVTFKENVEIKTEFLATSDIITVEPYETVYSILESSVHYTVNCVQTEQEKVPYVTYYTRNESLHAGQKVVLSKGSDGTKNVQYEVVVEDGQLISKNAINETVTKQPVNAKIQIGSAISGGLGTNLGLIFPVEGYITSEFGGRPDPFSGADSTHKGLDIGAVKGTPIYAASGGKVTQASNKNNGYGNCVIIEHSSGFSTLYAHCSELLVKEGEAVTEGQLIAKVGSTGRSTGPHLHFGMLVSGTYVDPLLYY